MKTPVLSVLALLAIGIAPLCADTSVALNNVHLCCGACVRGVEQSIKGIEGVSMTADKDSGTVTLTGADQAKVQKALNAMADGGYFGVSDKSEIKPVVKTGAKGKNVQSMIVTGVHLCCGGCVEAVDRAIKKTPGAASHTAKKNAKTFVVSGDFNDRKFFEALQSEGLSGKITTQSAPEPAAGSKSDKDKDH